MGRTKKTDRHDDFAADLEREEREGAREETRDQFENEMFTDAPESPFHVPRSEWPDGIAMRWISIEVTGAPDNRNWSMKTAAHWTPVIRGKYPSIDARFPTTPMPGTMAPEGGAITFGGLCLCERDIRYNKRDEKLQQKATQDQANTIDSYVEGGNSNFKRVNLTKPVEYERGVRLPQFKE